MSIVVSTASGAPDISQSPLTPTPVPTSMMLVAAVAAARTASCAPIEAVIGSTPSSSECWRARAMSSRSMTNSSAYFQLSCLSDT